MPAEPTGQGKGPNPSDRNEEFFNSLPPAKIKRVDHIGALCDSIDVYQTLDDIVSCYRQTISDIRTFDNRKKWINSMTREWAKQSTQTARIIIAILNGENELLQGDLKIADARLQEVARFGPRRKVLGRKIADTLALVTLDTRQVIKTLLDRDGNCRGELRILGNDESSAAKVQRQIYTDERNIVRDDLAAAYRRLLICCDVGNEVGNEVGLGFWHWRRIRADMKKLVRVERGRTVGRVGGWEVALIAEALALAIIGLSVVVILDVKSMAL